MGKMGKYEINKDDIGKNGTSKYGYLINFQRVISIVIYVAKNVIISIIMYDYINHFMYI